MEHPYVPLPERVVQKLEALEQELGAEQLSWWVEGIGRAHTAGHPLHNTRASGLRVDRGHRGCKQHTQRKGSDEAALPPL